MKTVSPKHNENRLQIISRHFPWLGHYLLPNIFNWNNPDTSSNFSYFNLSKPSLLRYSRWTEATVVDIKSNQSLEFNDEVVRKELKQYTVILNDITSLVHFLIQTVCLNELFCGEEPILTSCLKMRSEKTKDNVDKYEYQIAQQATELKAYIMFYVSNCIKEFLEEYWLKASRNIVSGWLLNISSTLTLSINKINNTNKNK